MDDALRAVVEINMVSWARFQRDIEALSADEADWRPLPEANTINLVVRHLCIDAAWHVRSIEGGRPDPSAQVPAADCATQLVPLDVQQNLRELGDLVARFIEVLGRLTLPDLQGRSTLAYKDVPPSGVPSLFLGYHFALHLAGHGAQIRTIRNLYETTRGRPGRFFPSNPTFPQEGAG